MHSTRTPAKPAPVNANVIALVLSSSRFVAKRREVCLSGSVRVANHWQLQAASCGAVSARQPISGCPDFRFDSFEWKVGCQTGRIEQ